VAARWASGSPARSLSRIYGERYAPPAILTALVERGDLGRKTGRGFFEWAP